MYQDNETKTLCVDQKIERVVRNDDIHNNLCEPDEISVKKYTCSVNLCGDIEVYTDNSQHRIGYCERDISLLNNTEKIFVDVRPTLFSGGSTITFVKTDDGKDISISEEDIILVADQSHASRLEAIESLRRNDGDIVNAIMDLTI